MHHDHTNAKRPEPDLLLQRIADYTLAVDRITSAEAFDTARFCLMDTLGCGLLALSYPAWSPATPRCVPSVAVATTCIIAATIFWISR